MPSDLARACAWVEARIPDLGIDPSTPLERRLASIKAIGDLANAADVVARSSAQEFSAIGARWLDVAFVQLGEGARIHELIAASPLYAPAALAWLPLHLSGRCAPALYTLLADQIRRATLPPLAWTMLVPALEMFDITPTTAMLEQASRTSVLAHRTAPELLPKDAAYVLVHECLYASRSGRVSPAWDDETARYVAWALPALIDRWIADRDADLLAETILAARCSVGRPAEPRELTALTEAQTSAGNVEPPATLDTMFPRLPHPVLSRTFHTTLVAIMAWSRH